MIKSITENNTWTNIHLSGEIYTKDATLLREEILTFIDQKKVFFHFDFSEVTFIDSAGLGVLVALHKRAIQHKGAVKVSNTKGSVKEIFELTRLHLVFQIDN